VHDLRLGVERPVRNFKKFSSIRNQMFVEFTVSAVLNFEMASVQIKLNFQVPSFPRQKGTCEGPRPVGLAVEQSSFRKGLRPVDFAVEQSSFRNGPRPVDCGSNNPRYAFSDSRNKYALSIQIFQKNKNSKLATSQEITS
jgi:hypothetical protein